MMMQYRATGNYLQFRGIEEEQDKDIRTKMAGLIAEFLNEETDRVEDKIDLVYRVHSTYAESEKFSRDVIIQFMSKKMKEDVLREHFQNPFRIQGTKIIIMKKIPIQMVQDRKGY